MDAALAHAEPGDQEGQHVVDDAWARTVPNLIVFFANVAIMVIELVASRLVARYIGSSLYTWTSVIGVILAGMSLGNHLGGRLADREAPERVLPYLFLVAAALSLGVLWLNDWTGRADLLAQLSWPVRIFTTVSLIFFAPACILGIIPPVVARLALDRARSTGSAIGNVYAWGAVGSILGTFATGFFLLSYFGTRTIVFTASGLLALIGLGLLVAFRLPGMGRAALGPDATADPARQAPSEREADPAGGAPLWERLQPNLLVFLSGMSIMITEMVAGRIMAKELGSSLYTWTSVIGVILLGIALGNYTGGKVADRFEPDRTLAHLFLLASVLVLTTIYFYGGLDQHRVFLADLYARHRPGDVDDVVDYPLWMRDPERSTWPYVYGGLARVFLYPFTSYVTWTVSIVVAGFLLPAAALGMISPVVSKLALERSKRSGETIGNIYAWGALGSIIGTFVPSFFLISWMGTRGVICLTALVLGVVSLCLKSSGTLHTLWAGLALTALIGATVPTPANYLDDQFAPRSRLASVVEEAQGRLVQMGKSWTLRSRLKPGAYETESDYFYILVYPSDKGESRTLRLDHLIHGYFFEGKPRMLEYEYERIYASIMERVGAMPTPDPSADQSAPPQPGAGHPVQTLFIGGGSYTFPRFIENAYPGSRVEVAEIDPAVTETVHKAMFLSRDTSIHTTHGDARNTVDHLMASGERFDFIYGDAFNDLSVPWHLTTLEFDRRIHSLLKPNGVYLINIIDSLRHARFLGSFVKTARQVFGGVAVYSTDKNSLTGGRDTFVIAMSDRPLDLKDLGSRPGERKFTGWRLNDAEFDRMIERAGSVTLTDDFAPVDNLLAPVARER
jgi:MFS family permease